MTAIDRALRRMNELAVIHFKFDNRICLYVTRRCMEILEQERDRDAEGGKAVAIDGASAIGGEAGGNGAGGSGGGAVAIGDGSVAIGGRGGQ